MEDLQEARQMIYKKILTYKKKQLAKTWIERAKQMKMKIAQK